MRKRKFGKTMAIIGLCLGLEMMMAVDKPSAKDARQQYDFIVAAVGDCLVHRPVSQSRDPQVLQLADLLRKADCTYGNCETTFFAPENGYPSYKAFDPNEFCYPFGADELKWFGIDLVSLANNHIMDFEEEGMYSTMNHLDRVGIVYAGAGSDLNQAARPGYFEAENGTVALISCSSWLPEKHHQASMPARYMKGKPGLNPINNDLILQLDEENFARLYDLKKSIIKSAGFPPEKEEEGKEITQIEFETIKFSKGEKVDYDVSPHQKDIERIMDTVKTAKLNARLVMVSLHEHNGNMAYDGPTEFQGEFARACIDAGADVFIGTGPHQLWGIEIYKGKPIFHSIGNFIFQTPPAIISPEAYSRIGFSPDSLDTKSYEAKFTTFYGDMPIWDSVVPFMTFDAQGKVKEILVYPIFLLTDKTSNLRGTPRLADPGRGKRILERLERVSKPYYTRFIIQNGIGKIVL